MDTLFLKANYDAYMPKKERVVFAELKYPLAGQFVTRHVVITVPLVLDPSWWFIVLKEEIKTQLFFDGDALELPRTSFIATLSYRFDGSDAPTTKWEACHDYLARFLPRLQPHRHRRFFPVWLLSV